MAQHDLVFMFMDTLPTVSECVSSIISHAPTYGSHSQKNTVYQFSLAIEDLWCKAFGREYIITLKTIRHRLDNYLKDYRTQVQKKKGHLNKRPIIKKWKTNNDGLFDLLNATTDYRNFEDDEKNFYMDQVNCSRRIILSDHIDVEYEDHRDETVHLQQMSDLDLFTSENEQIEPSVSGANQSLNRSGLTRSTKVMVDNSTQTVYVMDKIKPIRKIRNFDGNIKSTIATTSSRAGITVQQARRAYQASAEAFYEDQYYLTITDVPQIANSPQPLHSTLKRPRSSKDYNRYKYVLPSARVIRRAIYLQAIQAEKNCALAILDAEPEDKITIHYDTTRRRIAGEWTSLIVKLSSGLTFRMRPLSLAVENRETITKLLVEQFKRLSTAGNTTASALWEKVTSLMTDSVAKNLHIGESVAATLNSNHTPFHLLCVSHTCEVFDRGNLAELRKAEAQLGIHDILIARMPALKSFLSQNKSVTLVALEALNKLVLNDGHKSSQWELFEQVVNDTDTGRTKKHSQFKERRFAKLDTQHLQYYTIFKTISWSLKRPNLTINWYRHVVYTYSVIS